MAATSRQNSKSKKESQKNLTAEVVLKTLLDIEKNGVFSNIALGKALRANQFMSKEDRAYISRMVEGVVEKKIRLDYVINQFSKTKVNKCKPLIRCILRMGTYQIFYMDKVPDYAACSSSVSLAQDHGFGSLKGFVNGVLRNIARNKADIKYPEREDGETEYLSVKYSVPTEVIDILQKDYDGETIERILMDSDRAKPTSIRVNKNRISVTAFAERLRQSNITVESGELDDSVLLISGYDYIRKVPGYAEGLFTVQDQSSCVAVLTADIKPGDFIVDVCAAPGGKTCYAAQITGEAGKVVARDVSEDKTELIEDNVDRLGLSNVSVQVYDARILDESLIDKVDVVIADLPCSGLGIMSRKNDIKYNVTREKIKELVSLQREILDTVYKYVKPGGTLVYSTCTIDSMENGDNVKWFLENHDFKLSGSPEKGKEGYTTYIQGIDPGDGFFVAKFVRNN